MYNSLIELVFALIFAVVSGIMGVLVAYIQSKIKSENIGLAIDRIGSAAEIAVAQLEQEYVEEWKKAEGGKLSVDQISKLKQMSEELIISMLDAPAINLLNSVGIEIQELIKGLTEKAVLSLKSDK